LDVPERSTQLWVRVIGYTPRTVDLVVAPPETDIGDIRLDRVQELPGRLIEGRLVSESEFLFEERRKSGVGVYFDSTWLSNLPRVTAAALASKTTMIRAGSMRTPNARATGGETVLLRSSTMAGMLDGCNPRVYLDGVSIGSQSLPRSADPRGHPRGGAVTPEYLQELLRLAKRIEVYQAQHAPAEFADPDGCGSLVIWTK
jgi:hypothetical protein